MGIEIATSQLLMASNDNEKPFKPALVYHLLCVPDMRSREQYKAYRKVPDAASRSARRSSETVFGTNFITARRLL